jgi:hypothetical protein
MVVFDTDGDPARAAISPARPLGDRPWAEDGETWRRLSAVFPARVGTHNPDQVFYFGRDGQLLRHDYDTELACNIATRTTPTSTRSLAGSVFPRCGGPP